MRKQSFITYDGQAATMCIWSTPKKALGIIHIVHDAEFGATQYDNLAKFLTKNGYVVSCSDWDYADSVQSIVNLEMAATNCVRELYNAPVFFIGHGLGSFIVQYIMARHRLCAAAVCMANTARFSMLRLRLAQLLSRIGIKICDKSKRAYSIARLLHIPRAPMSYEFYYSLTSKLIQIYNSVPQDLPILIISGGRSDIAQHTRLATSLYRRYQEYNLRNLSIIIYPDIQHELLIDMYYADVRRDIIQFFNSVRQ